jgi:hypothetical protein
MTITEDKVTVTEAEPRKRGRPPKPLDPKFLAEVNAL